MERIMGFNQFLYISKWRLELNFTADKAAAAPAKQTVDVSRGNTDIDSDY